MQVVCLCYRFDRDDRHFGVLNAPEAQSPLRKKTDLTPWPKHPLIYEINTRVWLGELSRKAGRPLTLVSVPDEEWDRIASFGFDAVWLMGVWERSSASTRISMANESLLADFHHALPDFEEKDNVGSPYCVRRYEMDPHLGSSEALAVARRKLTERGMRLILDFVPNHVARDHPWVESHPEYFVQGSKEDLEREPRSFAELAGRVYACGRDPYFPAWADTLQLNAFDDGLRAAIIDTVVTIAAQCDGVRCDMAMLLMNSVFERTWGLRAGSRPEKDYWTQIIPAVKKQFPAFQFIAEAYWDLEWELQQQGFGYCYDKRLYDRLEHDSAESVRLHFCADIHYQEKLIRFIENHDEPRAAAAFNHEKHHVVAITALTVPGARLIHEGQLEGRRVRLPVFLARRPQELIDSDLQSFYRVLLAGLNRQDLRHGSWRLCELSGWPDNPSCRSIVSWCWQHQGSFCIIVVNLSGMSAQGLIHVPLGNLRGRSWKLKDIFSSVLYERRGDEMCESGLYVDLPPWGFHFLVSEV